LVKTDEEILWRISDTIEELKMDLSKAYRSYKDTGSTSYNLATINDAINNLNNMIDNFATRFTNDLQSEIDDLEQKLAETSTTTSCAQFCASTTPAATTTAQPTTSIPTTVPTTSTPQPTTSTTTPTTSMPTTVVTTTTVLSTIPTTTLYDCKCEHGGTCDEINEICICTPSWSDDTCSTGICESANPCQFQSSCSDGNPYKCTCVPGADGIFSGQNCTDYMQNNQTFVNATSDAITMTTTPYSSVIANWELDPIDSSHYFTLTAFVTISSEDGFLAVTDSSLPSPSTLYNYTSLNTGPTSFNTSVGGFVGFNFRGSGSDHFTVTYTTAVLDPCEGVNCNSGTCITSISNPTQYTCQCPYCVSGSDCEIDNRISDPNYCTTQIPGFCSDPTPYCCWTCSTVAPICMVDNSTCIST